MSGKSAAWLLAAGLSMVSGCATTGISDSVARATASLNPWKNRAEVSDELREAQRTLKDPETTLVSYARMKEDNQDYAEARERYREILTAYPDNVDASLGMARIERVTGRHTQAHEILVGLADKNPRNTQVQLELGRTFADQHEWDKAIGSFTEAVRIEPENQACRFELGLVLARSNRINDALPHLTFAVGTSAAMYNIGYVFQERGQKADAVQWYQEALAHHPDARTRQQASTMLAKLGAVSGGHETALASRDARATEGDRSGGTGHPAENALPAAQPQVLPDRLRALEPSSREVAAVPVRNDRSESRPGLPARQQTTSPGPVVPVLAPTAAQVTSGPVRTVSFTNPVPRAQADSLSPSPETAVPIRAWTGPTAGRTPNRIAPGAHEPARPEVVAEPPQWRARQ